MKIVVLLVIFIVLITPYIVNFNKLCNCDFESPYECEAIHGVGALVPPTSWVTMWFSTDTKD